MCGIAGVVVDYRRPAVADVDRLLDHLHHRGPDARGVHGGPGGAVGQTRLAVIDLATGDPPITCEDGAVGAVLNGEIYNFRALRDGLTASRHTLTTAGDTEVIAHLGGPGHVLTIEPGGEPQIEHYWHPPVAGLDGAELLDITFDEAAAEVRRLLTNAVERRLVTDVPIGAFLSGGVDSSALVGIMSGLLDRPVDTFTIGFESDGYDERPHARQVAERFGTDHTEFIVRPDATELLEHLLWHNDQPFGDSSALPRFLLAELTRKEGDRRPQRRRRRRVFAGYERFPADLARRRTERAPSALRRAMGAVADRVPAEAFRGRARSVQRLVGRPDLDTLQDLSRMGGVRARRVAEACGRPHRRLVVGRLRPLAVVRRRRPPRPPARPQPAHLPARRPAAQGRPREHGPRPRGALPLPRHRAGGACGPPPAGDEAAGIRPQAGAQGGGRRPALAPLLNRRKRGFGVPVGRWFREDLAPWVDDLLCSESSRCRHHLDGAAIDAYVADHQRTGAHGHGLWALISLETFLRREKLVT